MWTIATAFMQIASRIQVQRVVLYLMVEKTAHIVADFLDAGVAEFFYFSTINTNEVVVLLVAIRPLKLRHVFAKLVLGYQIAGKQQIKGVVNRCPAHPVIAVFHLDVERLHVEMVVAAVNFLQNGKAFWRFAVTVLFEVGRKDLLYFFYNLGGWHGVALCENQQFFGLTVHSIGG